jgi:dTDP-4-dehydrorhamnose reductase
LSQDGAVVASNGELVGEFHRYKELFRKVEEENASLKGGERGAKGETSIAWDRRVCRSGQEHGCESRYGVEDEPDLVNYYGHTKLKGEEEVKGTVDEYCISRASVIYGSTPAAGKTNFALWITERLRKGIRIRVATDQWISPTLNTNLSMMIAEALEKRLTGVYHMAGATRVTRFEMAKAIAEAFQLEGPLIEPVKMEELSWKARRPRDSSLDVSKASNKLENRPLELNDALKVLRAEMASAIEG